MANLLNVHGKWVNLQKPGGQVWFVSGGTTAYEGKGASDNNNGLSPQQPLSTIAQAVTNAIGGRGDTIVLLPGNVTITAAIVMVKDDVTLTGVDPNGSNNPSAITVNGAVDGISITGANVVIENLHFAASTASAVSRIDCAAAGATIRNNTFDCGTNDLETITIPAAGHYASITGNRFYITADGPNAAIEFESVGVLGIVIKDNLFMGQSNAMQWDVAAIHSDVAQLDCWIKGNTFTDGEAIDFSAAATGMISDNDMGYGTLGSMLDPGSCMCIRNFEADAINEKAREFPTTAAS